MSTTLTEPTSKAPHRRGTLEPYLLMLKKTLRCVLEGDARSPQVEIAGIVLPRDSWILSRIASPVQEEESPSELPELLRSTLALLLKSAADMERLRDGTGDLYALQAELMLDSALGTSFQREIQNAVDALVREGAISNAKSLSKIQHKLAEVVRGLKRSIADSNRGPGEQTLENAAEPDPSGPLKYELDGPAEEPPARRRRKPAPSVEGTPAAPGRPRSRLRTRALLALAVVAMGVRIVCAILPELFDRRSIVLTRGDFAGSAPIVEIVARPPSLYAAIDERVWEGYEESEKRRLVDEMGSVLLTNGYWGLLLRTPEGRPLAQWREAGGTRLLDAEPETNVAPKPTVTPNLDRFVH